MPQELPKGEKKKILRRRNHQRYSEKEKVRDMQKDRQTDRQTDSRTDERKRKQCYEAEVEYANMNKRVSQRSNSILTVLFVTNTLEYIYIYIYIYI